jgi:hypothetical protein
MADDISNLKPTVGQEADYRSFGPIKVCPCGSEWWNVKCKFDDDFEIGVYFTDATCVSCGSIATVVTSIDKG